MKIKKFSIPCTQDPFINTPLINAGFDPETGEERFWISTWNSNVGCIGALVTENGRYRIYRFKKANDGLIGCGAYSAYLTDNDTMWLISDLKAFVRLTLSTGEYEVFQTGAPSCLVFAGMQYDAETKKLLAAAYPCSTLHAVSFDTEKLEVAKIYKDFTVSTIAKGGFANGDGTYTLRFTTVHPSLCRWDPKAETLTEYAEIPNDCELVKAIRDDNGRTFVPYLGWLDVSDYSFSRDNMPNEDLPELSWFARRGSTAYGYRYEDDSNQMYKWDMTDGSVEKLCAIRDGGHAAMTADGHIVNVSVYGEFSKYNLSGELVQRVRMDSSSHGEVDCLIRVDEHTYLGTPFITQRFWLLDTETGEGIDAGRAAPGGGEVLRVWNINGKIYMASYCNGYLTEYDPKKPLDYPNNPRVVAHAEEGMRPVAGEQIGDVLYFACTHHYGTLGMCIMRYDAASGKTLYVDDPLHAQHIYSMYYHEEKNVIFAGTTYRSDCDVTVPESDECFVLTLCPDTLEITDKTLMPKGCTLVSVSGALDAENLLLVLHMPEGRRAASYSVKDKTIKLFDGTLEDYSIAHPGFAQSPFFRSRVPGKFAVRRGGKVSLCTVEKGKITFAEDVFDDEAIYNMYVCGDDVCAVAPDRVYIAEDALR